MNAPENHKLTWPDIQKDIVFAFAIKVSNAILKELGDSCFAILVDESRDISTKEQMTIVLHYVDKQGRVVERFFGLIHIIDTNGWRCWQQ